MQIRWFGQSAFLLTGREGTVMIDPFGDPAPLAARGVKFDYPAIVRLAGSHDTPIGPVLGVASEHDAAAGTERGPNAIFRFALDGLTVCHMGDFGQAALRDAQRDALVGVDLLLVPAGGGPTIGGEQAAAIGRELGAGWVVPMHYGTPAVDFLGPLDPFLAAFDDADVRHAGAEAELDAAERPAAPQALVLAPPEA